jgi:hypothetical protein
MTDPIQQTSKPLEIIVTNDLTCSSCGAAEYYDDPGSPSGSRLNIRVYKVGDKHGYWWSHCLVCDTWF